MNIQEYISSGILESYVLGGLNAEEAAEVERMALKHPEVRKELEEIQDTVNRYAKSYSATPSFGMKQKILDAIHSRERKSSGSSGIFSFEFSKEFTEYLAAASIGFAVLCAGASYFFYTKWQEAESKALALEAQQSVIAQHSNSVNFNLHKELEESKNMMSALMDSATIKVELRGMEMAPSAKAMVYWKKNAALVYLSVQQLPPPPDDMQYQLWAIKDGKPIDGGMIEMDSSSIHKMNNIGEAQAFAVTLEKKGGSSAPTMDAMYLMGKVSI